MITITLYTKQNCSLCDSIKADLLAIQPRIGFVLLEIDIDAIDDSTQDDSSEQQISQYANLVPVLDIENGQVLYSPFSYDELFDAIDEAINRSGTEISPSA